MGRLLRPGFDSHFTNRGHTCWMEPEDSSTSEAPLDSLDVEVLPPPGVPSNGKTADGARAAHIAAENERLEEGS